MKKIYLFIAFLLIIQFVKSQDISGHVFDKEGLGVPGVKVTIQSVDGHKLSELGSFTNVMTNLKGYYKVKNLPNGSYNVLFRNDIKTVKIIGKNETVNFTQKTEDVVTEEILVSANRASSNTPVTYTNLSKEEIQRANTGQDVPYLLSLTPSVVISSDAGAGVGYTSMRVRGTDMTRINVTLDGIPLNDSESHGVWWVNMPDFVSSVDNIQIQRGVGTSTNGAAAFGANINFKTNAIKKKAYAETDFKIGSFNTRKATFKAGTGLLKKHFTFDARLSKITSDGFIDRAASNLSSYHLSGAYISKKNTFRVNITSGHENTYQAWSGVPKDSLSTNRTFNPYTYENEVDNYNQKHYQMFYTHEFHSRLFAKIALHHTKGEGYYEQYKEGRKYKDYQLENLIIGSDTITKTDLVQRKWLKNNFMGAVYSLNYGFENFNAVLGGASNMYIGDHFGKVIWAEHASNGKINHEWYRNSGKKLDINEYLKMNYQYSKFNFWADMQFRTIVYEITGIHDDLNDITQNPKYYNFFNPKAGLMYQLSNQKIYFSFAEANREPSRSDFKDAEKDKMPIPETLFDYELGYEYSKKKMAFSLNLYYMDYQNQLIMTGEINNVGAAIMTNVPKSYRAGAELSAGIKLFDFMNWNFNATYSQNKIANFTEYVDNWDTREQESQDLGTTDIAFSPNIVAANIFSFKIYKGLNLDFTSKYVGEQFIDNTSSKERMLDAYFVSNTAIRYSFATKYIKEITLTFNVNNVFNEEYETNAWVYRYYFGKNDVGEPVHHETNGYFPQAGINFIGGINLRF